jgi:hypothetical protein
MVWNPYYAKIGFNGVQGGDIHWEGDSNGSNQENTMKIHNEDMAKQIIDELNEAIEQGEYK